MSYQLGKAYLQTQAFATLAFAARSVPENVYHQGVMLLTGEEGVVAETVRTEPRVRH